MYTVGILSDYLGLKEMCREKNFLAICPFNLFLACILNLGCGALAISSCCFFLTKTINLLRKKKKKKTTNQETKPTVNELLTHLSGIIFFQ